MLVNTLDTPESRFEAFQGAFNTIEFVSFIFLIVIIGEALWDIIKGQREKKESLANFSILVVNVLLERTAYGLVFVFGLFVTESFVTWAIPITWWSWVLAVILADLTYYWMHRWEHEVRFLWAYHSVHHSSPEFNLTTSLRLAWIEGVFEWLFFVPMILIGFDAFQVLIGISIVVAYQTWIHTEKIGKLGWMDLVFNTPSVHRVHHGANPQYIDKNYGGVLMLWDRLFGTYESEDEPVTFGITTPIKSSNPITINLHEYVQISKDVVNSKRFSHAIKYIFGRPGWQPKPEAISKEDPNETRANQ